MQYGKPVFGTVQEDYPCVQTTSGLVKGKNRDGVAIFQSIPYGDKCSGNHRFLPPKSVKAWAGIKDCTSYRAYMKNKKNCY